LIPASLQLCATLTQSSSSCLRVQPLAAVWSSLFPVTDWNRLSLHSHRKSLGHSSLGPMKDKHGFWCTERHKHSTDLKKCVTICNSWTLFGYFSRIKRFHEMWLYCKLQFQPVIMNSAFQTWAGALFLLAVVLIIIIFFTVYIERNIKAKVLGQFELLNRSIETNWSQHRHKSTVYTSASSPLRSLFYFLLISNNYLIPRCLTVCICF